MNCLTFHINNIISFRIYGKIYYSEKLQEYKPASKGKDAVILCYRLLVLNGPPLPGKVLVIFIFNALPSKGFVGHINSQCEQLSYILIVNTKKA